MRNEIKEIIAKAESREAIEQHYGETFAILRDHRAVAAIVFCSRLSFERTEDWAQWGLEFFGVDRRSLFRYRRMFARLYHEETEDRPEKFNIARTKTLANYEAWFDARKDVVILDALCGLTEAQIAKVSSGLDIATAPRDTVLEAIAKLVSGGRAARMVQADFFETLRLPPAADFARELKSGKYSSTNPTRAADYGLALLGHAVLNREQLTPDDIEAIKHSAEWILGELKHHGALSK